MTLPQKNGEKEEAFRVYVFVDDDDSDALVTSGGKATQARSAAVSADDIATWLGEIGPVEYTKLQYDTSSQRSCFCVRFRRAESARQACEHLNGVRLKNHPIRIRSQVYTPVTTDSRGDATEEQTGRETGVEAEKQPVRPSDGLPDNHFLPAELRMDVELADLLSADLPPQQDDLKAHIGTDFSVLRDRLRANQKTLHQLLRAIEDARDRITDIDGRLANARQRDDRGGLNLPPRGEPKKEEVPRAGSGLTTGARTEHPVPAALCSAKDLVSFISLSFGPLSWCHCLYDTTGEEDRYYLFVGFMMAPDRTSLLEASRVGQTDRVRSTKRARSEHDQRDTRLVAAELAFFSTDWVAQ